MWSRNMTTGAWTYHPRPPPLRNSRSRQGPFYLRAEVMYLEDEPGEARAEEIELARKLHAEIMELAGAEAEGATPSTKTLLSFHLAGSLPLDLDFKQSLLAHDL